VASAGRQQLNQIKPNWTKKICANAALFHSPAITGKSGGFWKFKKNQSRLKTGLSFKP